MRSLRTICRRYTSAMLVAVGAAAGLTLAAFGVWWVLIAAIMAAFLFGAALARPWCVAAPVGAAESRSP